MKKKAKYYTVNKGKHIITIDKSITPTKDEDEEVERYIHYGYDMRFKSQEKAKKMREKMEKRMKENPDNLNAAAIREALKDDEEGLKKFEAIIKGDDKEYKKGFFSAKKWYYKYTNNK